MKHITKTDLKIVAKNSGILMIGIGIMCLIPLIVDVIYLELDIVSFVLPAAISIGLGYFFMRYFEDTTKRIRLKHGMMISSFAWFWAGIIGGLVISLSTNIPLIDGIFESVSALTGTGITIIANIEILPHSILFFRALEQWVGGLGVIVIVLRFVSKNSAVSSKLYESEARDDRLKPSTKRTIQEILKIYSILTAIGIILLVIAGMPVFDAFCNTFCLISTGGMAVKNANIGYYQNDMIYLISIIIMILGATSFMAIYSVKKTKGKSLIRDSQFRILLSTIAIVSLMLYFLSNIIPMELVFTITSTITTTGASVTSVETMAGWPSFVIICLMCMMLIGGSNGSTVGAIKLNRTIIFLKGIRRNVREIISPYEKVPPVKLNGNAVKDQAVGQAGNFISLYMIFILITWALFCLFGSDPFKSLFTAMSLQGNNGLELGIITHTISPILKIVSMIDMWTGRLEIYPVLILLRSAFEVFKSIK